VNASNTSAEPVPDLPLEIAYLLLIDLVGYSKLLVNEQIEIVEQLNQIVRATESFRTARADGKLIRVPTGDGMALLFFQSPEEPVRCALEVGKTLRDHPRIQVRMGIHSGPISRITHVDDKMNVAGAGINVAQRVLDCGDAGHILLSAHVAEDLAHYRHWQPYLHDLGQCEVKHGRQLHLFNLYKDSVGNPQIPQKLKGRMPASPSATAVAPSRRRMFLLPIALALLAVASAVGVWMYFTRESQLLSGKSLEPVPAASIPEKSIAVLPFDNLSSEIENAHFATGMQDEILNDLAKVADLKVISRTSVMQYKAGAERNLRQIARELGVAHVLEGSVQRAGDRVRVNAQLIDAKSDAHLWAEHYDRDLADVFAIQSEIAESIVAQLKAKLSASEKAAIDVRPTRDPEALDLYLQAKQLLNTFYDSPNRKETLLRSLRLLDEAISRDPNFALAYCAATRANEALHWFDLDHTPARLAQARAMAQKAIALAPESGEAHLAQALVYYQGDRDYTRAREELAIAHRLLPNNAEIYSVTAWIDRREGRWEEAVKNQERAAELDPRNSQILSELALVYDVLRRYDKEESVFDRAVAANPSTATYFQLLRAQVELQKANLETARKLLDSLPPEYDPDGAATATRINLALYNRDAGSAANILAGSKLEELAGGSGTLLPRSWFEAFVARAEGDAAKARDAFVRARSNVENKLKHDPDDGVLLSTLAVIDAGLLRNNEALAEAKRAVALRPISSDALDGAVVLTNLSIVHTWLGNKDSALEQLEFLAKTPGGPDYGQLKFDPTWDGLRGDPRFMKIIEELRPVAVHELSASPALQKP
jgi:TolB-like protein/class 3 adenylate cyclase/Tfp pilus assembly protein PilF